MSDIHYFQRYSQPENVITNNTLRLFAQIYQDNPGRLKRLLEGLVDGVEIEIGVDMQQQTSGASSLPDGALQQSSFKVVIETKRSKEFGVDQLRNHVDAFDDEEQRILILLAPETDEEAVSKASAAIEQKDDEVIFTAVTFEDIIDLLIGQGELISTYEQDLYELVNDYQNFCSGEGLLTKDDVLRAVPCGKSHKENVKFNLYYAPASRSYRSHQFIGIYYKQSIRHIGRLDRAVAVDRIDGALKVQSSGADPLTDNERERILGAIDAATKRGWDIGTDHEFFLVEKFYDTDFSKTSKYGMMGAQYFRIREALGIDKPEPLPTTEKIADQLRSKSWT